MSSFTINCPSCGYSSSGGTEELIGRQVSCPKCSSGFTIDRPDKQSDSTTTGVLLVSCTNCAKEFKIPEKYAGKSASCPSCKGKITVPLVQDKSTSDVEEQAPTDEWQTKYHQLSQKYPHIKLSKTNNAYVDLVLQEEFEALLDGGQLQLSEQLDKESSEKSYIELSKLLGMPVSFGMGKKSLPPNTSPALPSTQRNESLDGVEKLRMELLRLDATGESELIDGINEGLLQLAYKINQEEEYGWDEYGVTIYALLSLQYNDIDHTAADLFDDEGLLKRIPPAIALRNAEESFRGSTKL